MTAPTPTDAQRLLTARALSKERRFPKLKTHFLALRSEDEAVLAKSFAMLCKAAVSDDAVGIKEALKSGAKIDQRDVRSGETALMKAVMLGNVNSLNALVKKGADTEIPDQSGEVALSKIIFAKKNSIAVANILLAADPPSQQRLEVLKSCAELALSMAETTFEKQEIAGFFSDAVALEQKALEEEFDLTTSESDSDDDYGYESFEDEDEEDNPEAIAIARATAEGILKEAVENAATRVAAVMTRK